MSTFWSVKNPRHVVVLSRNFSFSSKHLCLVTFQNTVFECVCQSHIGFTSIIWCRDRALGIPLTLPVKRGSKMGRGSFTHDLKSAFSISHLCNSKGIVTLARMYTWYTNSPLQCMQIAQEWLRDAVKYHVWKHPKSVTESSMLGYSGTAVTMAT